LGFSKIAPPSTSLRDVHSRFPSVVSHVSSPSARHRHTAGPVTPPRFLTALTLFSVTKSAGLLRPAADPGVREVRLLHHGPGPWFSHLLHARPYEVLILTSSRPALDSPARRARGPSLHVVPPPKRSRLQGFVPLDEAVVPRTRCHAWFPDTSLGFSLPIFTRPPATRDLAIPRRRSALPPARAWDPADKPRIPISTPRSPTPALSAAGSYRQRRARRAQGGETPWSRLPPLAGV